MDAQMLDLEQLLDAVARGEVGVPDFQREFVWSGEDVKSLLGTVLNGWPAGSLLLMRGDDDLFRLKPIESAPALSKVSFIVLDGQQRLTGLYQALRDAGPTVFAIHFPSVDFEEEYLNLEEHIFLFPRERWDQNFRSVAAHIAKDLLPVYALASASDFFAWRDTATSVIADGRLREQLTSLYRRRLAQIHKYKFPALMLESDLEPPAIARIFERVNRSGLRLATFDLMVARTYDPAWNLRDEWEIARTNSQVIDSFLDDGMPILQTIALSERNDVRQSAVLKLAPESVRNGWEAAVTGMEQALNFLINECGVAYSDWLPYNVLAVALASFASRYDLAEHSNALRRWFWSRSFSLFYDAAANTRVVADYRVLMANASDGLELTVPPVSERILLSATRKSHRALWAAFLCALQANGARDLLGYELEPDSRKHPALGPIRPTSIAGAEENEDAIPLRLRVLNVVLASRQTAYALRRSGLLRVVDQALERSSERDVNEALTSQFLPESRVILDENLTGTRLLLHRAHLLEGFLADIAGQSVEREDDSSFEAT